MKDAETLPADAAVAIDGELPVVDSSCYELGEELARGGFGRLIRARDKRLDREVAIKQLRASNAQLEARFRLEARITARLSHPAIVPVHEVGRWPSGEPFYAMKLVAGRSLRDVLDATPALADRLALVPALVDVADAVGYAHGEGVLHRDLKPSNIMIDERGDAFLVDWGLARDRPGTDEGSVLGTPPYLSPEQARGDAVDERADVYSYGALLYELIAGTAPYAGDSDAVLAAIAVAPPPRLIARQPSAPRDLVAIVERAMERDMTKRYATGRELADDLRRFSRGELVAAYRYSIVERSRRFLRRHRTSTIAFAMVLVASAAAITWFATRATPRAWQPEVRELETFEENSNAAVFSPDGKSIAYDSTREQGENMQIWLGPIDGPARRVAPQSRRQTMVRFTRDGKHLLFRSTGGYYRVPITGGDPILVAPGATTLDDCAGVLVGLRLAREDCGGCPVQVVAFEPAGVRVLHELEPLYAAGLLRCDLQGRRVVFDTPTRPWTRESKIYVLDLAGGPPREVASATRGHAGAVFHPDGKSIIYASAPNGTVNLWEQSLAGGAPAQLTFGGGPDVAPDVSPDGKHVLFDVDVTSRPVFEVVIGQAPRRLTTALGMTEWLIPSHDGRWLVYQIAQRGQLHVVLRSLANGEERVIAQGAYPNFSADDATIYFARGGQVFTIPRKGGSEQLVGSLDGTIEGLMADRHGIVHVLLIQSDGARAWRLDRDGVATLESASHAVVIPAPAGDWTVAFSAAGNGIELVPPGGTLGAPTNERFAHNFYWWDADGTSFIWKDGTRVYRHHLESKRDELVLTLDVEPRFIAPGHDPKTFYYSVSVGRVRRHVIANYGERPRPR